MKIAQCLMKNNPPLIAASFAVGYQEQVVVAFLGGNASPKLPIHKLIKMLATWPLMKTTWNVTSHLKTNHPLKSYNISDALKNKKNQTPKQISTIGMPFLNFNKTKPIKSVNSAIAKSHSISTNKKMSLSVYLTVHSPSFSSKWKQIYSNQNSHTSNTCEFPPNFVNHVTVLVNESINTVKRHKLYKISAYTVKNAALSSICIFGSSVSAPPNLSPCSSSTSFSRFYW